MITTTTKLARPLPYGQVYGLCRKYSDKCSSPEMARIGREGPRALMDARVRLPAYFAARRLFEQEHGLDLYVLVRLLNEGGAK
jgi:hypothetical protein